MLFWGRCLVGRCIYGFRFGREVGVGGKDLGVIRIEVLVEVMEVDGIGEGVCVCGKRRFKIVLGSSIF